MLSFFGVKTLMRRYIKICKQKVQLLFIKKLAYLIFHKLDFQISRTYMIENLCKFILRLKNTLRAYLAVFPDQYSTAAEVYFFNIKKREFALNAKRKLITFCTP